MRRFLPYRKQRPADRRGSASDHTSAWLERRSDGWAQHYASLDDARHARSLEADRRARERMSAQHVAQADLTKAQLDYLEVLSALWGTQAQQQQVAEIRAKAAAVAEQYPELAKAFSTAIAGTLE